MFFRQAVCKLIKGFRCSASLQTKVYNSVPNAGKLIVSIKNDFRGQTNHNYRLEVFPWLLLSGQAAFIIGTSSSPSMTEDVSTESSSEYGTSADDFSDLQKLEDGSMISNEHTSKWRVFFYNGRDYFSKGNIDQAEKLFLSALKEAKECFGERDPHVATSCNNLAELYRVKKDFGKAEPLYEEAINILEEYFGVNDIRVGAALDNLGQFYFIQREWEKARVCYERALKIKRSGLGEDHTEYADTMYHLGTIFYYQGKQKEAEDLIVNSIEIMEAGGHDQYKLCIRRLALAQIYYRSNRFAQSENLLRKILSMMEILKGWKSLDTVVVAECLSFTLDETGRSKEAGKLLERCLDARKNLLPYDHAQSADDMLKLANIKMYLIYEPPKMDKSQAIAELDKAKSLLNDSIRGMHLHRIAGNLLVELLELKGDIEPVGVFNETAKARQSVASLLLRAFSSLGTVEVMQDAILGSKEQVWIDANAALRLCISTFQKLRSEPSVSGSPDVKAAYVACVRNMNRFITMQVKNRRRDAGK